MSTISIVIPSYNRGPVLLQTVEDLLTQSLPAEQLIVVDQTQYEPLDDSKSKLTALDKGGQIIWKRIEKPSIPAAMNQGLLLATSKFVLFLDDDIRVESDFLSQHRQVLKSHDGSAHVGQVLQPGERPTSLDTNPQRGSGLKRDFSFPFNSTKSTEIYNCMAGNLCVHRATAIAIGGFDQNFIGAAYRFETEFCRRFMRHSRQPFHFAPSPVIHHLKLKTGGTRSKDHFLTSSSPVHSMGDYYYALLEGRGLDRLKFCFHRFFSSIAAKYYVKRPWYIPVRMAAELRGFLSAMKYFKRGPSLIERDQRPES